MDKDLLNAILDGYTWAKRLNYIGISGFTLVVFDFLQTFPDEVRYMWPAPFSFLKVLFFLLRYYIMGHIVFVITYGYPTGLSPEECKAGFSRITISSFFVIVFSEWILFIRVWAFSGRDKKLRAILLFQVIALHGAIKITLLTLFVRSVKYVRLPLDNLPCMPAEANDILLSGTFALLLGSVTSTLIIMIYLAYRRHRDLETTLLSVFYRDGIVYFACLSILATLNIIINTTSRARGLKYSFTQIEVISHVILSTRMLLHLRKCAAKENVMTDGVEENQFPSTIQFKTGPPRTVQSVRSAP